ncbi:hypothetical protein M758_3G137300 [Ceratodon purpureus]|nr:hypothetical protein M758_3G137300 [Ceratodon purpureus]
MFNSQHDMFPLEYMERMWDPQRTHVQDVQISLSAYISTSGLTYNETSSITPDVENVGEMLHNNWVVDSFSEVCHTHIQRAGISTLN